MDWRHAGEILASSKRAYDALLNLCVWAKDKGGMGSFYRSQHEFIFVFRNGKTFHRNNVQLGRFGRNRTNGNKRSINSFTEHAIAAAMLASAMLAPSRPGRFGEKAGKSLVSASCR
jgi:hypothetical protein